MLSSCKTIISLAYPFKKWVCLCCLIVSFLLAKVECLKAQFFGFVTESGDTIYLLDYYSIEPFTLCKKVVINLYFYMKIWMRILNIII
jgi:hypothetical protein